MPQKHIYIEDGTYFVTVNVAARLPFFKSEILCDLWIEELRFCKEVKQFDLFSFCLNYDHFHLLIRPSKDSNVSESVKFLKENFSRDANKILGFNPVQSAAATAPSRLQLQEIIFNLHSKFHQKFPNYTGPKFKWQSGFHDQVIRDEKDLHARHNYCENNFLKHNLPTNWKYTSLNFSELIDEL